MIRREKAAEWAFPPRPAVSIPCRHNGRSCILLIGAVHVKVVTLFWSVQLVRTVPMATGVTKAVAAITRAAATRPAGSVCAPRAGPDPTAQEVSVPKHTGDGQTPGRTSNPAVP